jgi:hypothetical protein
MGSVCGVHSSPSYNQVSPVLPGGLRVVTIDCGDSQDLAVTGKKNRRSWGSGETLVPGQGVEQNVSDAKIKNITVSQVIESCRGCACDRACVCWLFLRRNVFYCFSFFVIVFLFILFGIRCLVEANILLSK